MSILSNQIKIDSASIDDQYKRKYTRGFLVLATIDMSSYHVRAALPVGIYALHPDDHGSICVGIDVDLAHPVQGEYAGVAVYAWDVKYSYGPWNPLEHTATGNPVDQPLRPRIVPVNTPKPVWEDVDGNPIVNSAGDFFDPPLERDFPRWTLTVVRNQLSANMATLGAYANRVNESTWLGFPPKTVKISPIALPAPEYSQSSDLLYYPIEYAFEINFDTWVAQVPNLGYRQLDPTGKLIPILVGGVPASAPVALDASGHAVITPGYLNTNQGAAPDEPTGTTEYTGGTGTTTGTATSVIINGYEIYRPMDFALLDSGFSGSQQLAALTF